MQKYLILFTHLVRSLQKHNEDPDQKHHTAEWYIERLIQNEHTFFFKPLDVSQIPSHASDFVQKQIGHAIFRD